ncbi:hypothetical protein Rhopal_001779-T1 [Rhodotorula paludigena]|uniref:Uncharacterized protein n=1 Tax=Rhodotorula paludigena TaxID=86838 RepID=A0AAV5GJE6_9BASI|nr:hypothetical protein Rhopal_001779-T1 [Rhodotorula paludigena]
MLHERGGAGITNDPLASATAVVPATPPKSTYHGPKVGGSYGGFVALFVAVGIFLLVVVVALAVWRFCLLRRRAARAEHRYADTRRPAALVDDDDEWTAAGDAFDMPALSSEDPSRSVLDLPAPSPFHERIRPPEYASVEDGNAYSDDEADGRLYGVRDPYREAETQQRRERGDEKTELRTELEVHPSRG